MSTVIRPGTLRHVCKEPLSEVQSVQLRGRGITRLVGLDACPALTSLDISWNALTELDSACLEGCKELWVVDASHNRLESLGGLFSMMALGYLNLSDNCILLSGLGPLARAHILELFLGSGRSAEERRRALCLVPNVWVLDDEFVTAQERRFAEDNYHHGNGGAVRSDHLLPTWKTSPSLDKPEQLRDHNGGVAADQVWPSGIINIDARKHMPPQKESAPTYRSGFGDLEAQGHLTREFYENVVWKIPSRTGAADSFRLTTLLERYDQRAATANRAKWLGSFTRGGAGGGVRGVRGSVRRDWSLPLPRPHAQALLSLPLELKLDVAVLLAVRASVRESIPQQVLAEAFMVLLVPHADLPDRIHNDLSRVPAFICTALVHVLRSSILRVLDQDSVPGHADTTAPPLLDRQKRDLLEALPPVVTGVDVDNVFERWEISSRNTTVSGLNPEEETEREADAGGGTHPVHAPPLGAGLMRLCRRAVILFTRSPACPDLVAGQTAPMDQRTYNQMEPLLARAKLSHGDLHPISSFSGEVGGDGRRAGLDRRPFASPREHSPSTSSFDLLQAGGDSEERGGGVDDRQQQGVGHRPASPVDIFQPPDDGFWWANIRRPRAGERVQVLRDTWTLIVTVDPESSLVIVAPFDGIQAPSYRGEARIDSRNLCYDPRGWWRHIPALTTNAATGPGRLHRLAHGLSASGLPWGAGSLNEPLEESEVKEPPEMLSGCPSDGKRQVTIQPSQNYAVDVFSAEGTWDPVFVLAPPRLVGLQNQTAARKKGRRKDRQVGWHRIDGPEASVAPRPLMPRCSSLPTPVQVEGARSSRPQRSASIPSIPGFSEKRPSPRLAAAASSHGGSRVCPWFSQSKSLSMPSMSTSSCLTTVAERPPALADEAWHELQREMGSLKADNRMLLRDSRGGSAGAVGCINTPTLCGSPSALSVFTKSLAGNSGECAEATTDLLAKPLSLALDNPVSARKGSGPEDTPTTVFELTQVDREPKKDAKVVATATCDYFQHKATPTTGDMRIDNPKRAIASSERSSGQEGEAGGAETSSFPRDTEPSQRRRRTRLDSDVTPSAIGRRWRSNAYRSLEWFPVPGRVLLLVDPNDVKVTPTAQIAGRVAEYDLPNTADFTSEGRGAEGGGGGGGGRYSGRCKGKEDRGRDSGKQPGSGSFSARSAFPSAAVLGNFLLSPAPNNDARARPRVRTGNRRPNLGDPSPAGALRASGDHNSDGPRGDASSGSLDLTANQSTTQKWFKPYPGAERHGGNRDPGRTSHLVKEWVEQGGGATGLAVMPANVRRAPRSCNKRSEGEGGGADKAAEAGGVNPRPWHGAAAAATNAPISKREGELQTNQRPLRPKVVEPRQLRDKSCPKRGVPQHQWSTISGWAGEDNGCEAVGHGWLPVFRQSKRWELETSGRIPSVVRRKSGRGAPGGVTSGSPTAYGGVGANARPISPRHSDNGLEECFSISSSAATSNNSCCGWKKTVNSYNH